MKEQIVKSILFQKVKDAFKSSTEEEMNGETAVNLELEVKNDVIKVYFDIDLGRGGIDSHYTSLVKFDNGKVSCELGESLEGGGIEELVEEKLTEFAKKLMKCEVINDFKTAEINQSTTPEEALSIVKTILSDLGVKYEEDGIDDTVTIKYELPVE